MQFIPADTIKTWERFYRANFVNSLTGFKSLSIIGTVDASGLTNLGLFSSIVHIGSNPSLIGFINRPVKAAPHTLANIRATGVYTLNHVHPSYLPQAHQASAKYPEGISEFNEVGLTPEYLEGIAAPFVKESQVKYALVLREIIPITFNDTFLVIGELLCVQITDGLLLPDGFLELDKAQSVSCNGADAYYSTQLIDRYQYAKPGNQPTKII